MLAISRWSIARKSYWIAWQRAASSRKSAGPRTCVMQLEPAEQEIGD